MRVRQLLRRINADDRQVCFRVFANQIGRKDLAIGQRDFQLVRSMDNVTIRENKAVRRDNKTGAGTAAFLSTLSLFIRFMDADIDHRRADLIDRAGHCPRIAVQQLLVTK